MLDEGTYLKTASIAFFKKRDYDINKPVVVSFEGEAAVVGGEPGREYFPLLLKSILSPCTQINLFEGTSFIVQPLHNTDALRASMFKVAGRMIAASIVNGGPSFPYLSPAVYKYLTTKSTENVVPDITRSDVVAYEVLQAIDKVWVKLVPVIYQRTQHLQQLIFNTHCSDVYYNSLCVFKTEINTNRTNMSKAKIAETKPVKETNLHL